MNGGHLAWPLNHNRGANPDARWKVTNLVSAIDGEIARTPIKKVSIEVYCVINKNFEHPEALPKMINMYYEFSAGRSIGGPEYGKELLKAENGFVYEWSPVRFNDTYLMSRQYKLINEALETGDISSLTEPMKKLYEQTKEIKNGKFSANAWGGYYSRVAPDGGWGLTEKVREEERIIENEFYGPYTPTMLTSKSSLDTLKKGSVASCYNRLSNRRI